MAKILKAKYYPRTFFIEAKVGTKPSFAWRSILGVRDLLEASIIWKVGNGQSIDIWGDKWVPIPLTFRAHSLPMV